MTQTPGIAIRSFLAGLWGQAALCQYTATCKEQDCEHTYDFSNEIIKDNLVRGMADQEIMSDLLWDSKTDGTLEETVQFIAQKEQGKVTQSAVGQHVGLKALTTPSTHIKKKVWNTPNQKPSC